ncbi:MAG TPA: DHHA1 domain-containing protein [Blastocatellia bacterium]|nr:DHHA1 domain-containing protein [Blastocatellia bacterium]
MGTERLYFNDSALLQFEAVVVSVQPRGDKYQVELDRTAFYPTGGGQPNDTGKLEGADVVDVVDDEESGRIIHIVDSDSGLRTGLSVTGQVDAARRLDHLQQHSGQHILSQAFVQACGAETRSFHLGAVTSTIDIELASPRWDHMRGAEDIANGVVFDDRLMRVHMVNEEEAAKLPLRKESAVRGTIRVIEVENFDWSPCGGTHAKRAGQVGLIAIKSFERAKKMTRVEFVCGGRSLTDYRLANQTAVATARLFSRDRESGPASVEKTIEENKSLKKRVRELLEISLVAEAKELIESISPAGTPGAAGPAFKLVKVAFDGRDLEEIRLLAYKLIEHPPVVALLGTKEAGAARLIFARSGDLAQDMGALLAEACQSLGGRGGGKPEIAQGGGPSAAKLAEVLDAAAAKL